MGKLSEIDALRIVDETLSGLEDVEARNRILEWAWAKFSKNPNPASSREDNNETTRRPKKKSAGKNTKAKGKSKGKSKTSPTLVKDLNLKQKGKKARRHSIPLLARKNLARITKNQLFQFTTCEMS